MKRFVLNLRQLHDYSKKKSDLLLGLLAIII